ncbi:hypothetical protein H1230_24780 [Paenibacillus sp. 19GGS1-52]|uniref:hypothetical protein n=1 Tax=Paenibacillus sp. 19GGS1-52 TaxID=2758563 RepID=UPI001EFBBF36|nr:hypothetical protein [Paenibacillus sp. 19GGS1-52]ULO06222.1 hypothetical protein H1230_24780 [Paenibacillus sp. 19GGS1-52]
METIKSRYAILGTLGDNEGFLTCSMHIAKNLNNADTIVPYPLFEEAAKDLKSERISCLLVPGAYPKINSFIMDSELEVSESFVKKIPALVLSGFGGKCPENIDIIFHHPATTYLLSEITTSYKENIAVSSNPEGCRMVIKNINRSITITNQLCADHYGLTTYKVLRKGINMPWVCFIKRLKEREL